MVSRSETEQDTPGAPPQEPRAGAPGTVLPQPRTPLVGRSRERAELCRALLDTGSSLLTLTGPGGVGKTRLALHLAHDLRGHSDVPFPDGIWWVDVSPIRDPGAVATAIGAALGFHDGPSGDPFGTLRDRLRSRHHTRPR